MTTDTALGPDKVLCRRPTQTIWTSYVMESRSYYGIPDMLGSHVLWKAVSAVYAVNTTTAPDTTLEVITLDDTNVKLKKV